MSYKHLRLGISQFFNSGSHDDTVNNCNDLNECSGSDDIININNINKSSAFEVSEYSYGSRCKPNSINNINNVSGYSFSRFIDECFSVYNINNSSIGLGWDYFKDIVIGASDGCDVNDYISEDMSACNDVIINGNGNKYLYRAQLDLLNSINSHNRILIKKSRCVGVSTALALYCAYNLLCESAYNKCVDKNNRILIVFNNRNIDIALFMKKLELILLRCGSNLINRIIKTGAIMKNGNSITCSSINFINVHAVVRGQDLDKFNMIIFDEVDTYNKNFQLSLNYLEKMAIDNNKKIIITATPSKINGYFYNKWRGEYNNNKLIQQSGIGVDINNVYKLHEVKWNDFNNRDDRWYNSMLSLYQRMYGDAQRPYRFMTDINAEYNDARQKTYCINIRTSKYIKDNIEKVISERNIKTITDYIVGLVVKDLKI